MADEEEVVVTIEPEATEAADGAAEVVIKDPALADLAKQYTELESRSKASEEARDDARRRQAKAEQEALQARREADEARTAVVTSNMDTVVTALTAAQNEVEAAKRDMRVAAEAGDIAAQTEAIDRLTTSKALVMRYDEAKSDLEAQAKRPKPERRPAPTADDPVEAYVANRATKTAEWLRDHKEYVLDAKKNHKLNAAHSTALSEGIEPDTPEYFERVEKYLGLRHEAADNGDGATRPSAARKPAARPVAPVAGSRGAGGGSGTPEVRLSSKEALSATDGTLTWNYDDPSGQKKFRKGDPIGVQEFARRKLKMTQQGLYDRVFTES